MALYTVSPDAAQANYYRLKVIYFGKLQQRLQQGLITQDYYDQQVNIFQGDLQNPDNLLAQAGDFDFNKFWQDVADYAGQTAAKAINIATSAAASVGQGAIKGFFGSLSITTWIIIAVVAYFGFKYWKKGLIVIALLVSINGAMGQGNYINSLSPVQVNQVSNALYQPLLLSVSNAVYNALLTAGKFVSLDANFNALITNNIVWTTNAWPGPTNTLDMNKGYYVYNSFTACSVTGLANIQSGKQSSMYFKNLAATNWVLTFPPNVLAPDGTHTGITVTNGQVAYVGFDPTQETNVVTVHYY